MTSRQHNMNEVQSEVLGAIMRASRERRAITIGQVERHLMNVHLNRRTVKRMLDDLWSWGIIRRDNFQYRKNVVSIAYSIDPKAMHLAKAIIWFNENLRVHFMGWKIAETLTEEVPI